VWGEIRVYVLTRPVLAGCLLQGAHIGENVVIDTLDVTDFDLISIGDNVAIGEGATVMGHYYKDGFLHFDEVMHASP
jgi:acetyltransferase-like isoleucine patch superfamily enzyme